MIKAITVNKPASKFGGMVFQTLSRDAIVTSPFPADHVTIKMVSSRINPVDVGLAAGLPFASMKRPIQIGGVDGAGVITDVGSEVTDFQVDDEVFMYCEFSNFGTWADEIVVPASYVAKKPKSMTLQDTGALSLIAPTAYHALYNLLKIDQDVTPANNETEETEGTKKQKSILILGGAGGVGFSAVQMAVASGLKVIANAGSERSIAKLQKAGVHRVINYKTEKVVDVLMSAKNDGNNANAGARADGDAGEDVEHLDYIFDAAGKDSMSELIKKLRPTRICSVSHPNPDAMAGVGIELGWFWRTALSTMAWSSNWTAKKHGVELLGQVTTASGSLLAATAEKIDSIDGFAVDYKTISFSELEATGLDEKCVGKVITFGSD